MHPTTPLRMAIVALATLVWSDAGQAMVPAHDSDVVEVLRDRPLDAEERQWRTLRQRARQDPTNLPLAVQVASQAMALARRDGDPRLIGQAQAALGHWWAQPRPPDDVRLWRAIIRQSTHDFSAALTDLKALTSATTNPANLTQAWLVQASVLQVTGRYDDAQLACAGLGRGWLGQACTLELASYMGQATTASAQLDQLARQAPGPLQAYITLIRAELAERLGQPRQAEALYLSLLSTSDDAYTEGAYADLLLDQGRAAEVVTRLRDRQRNDALLLRLAEAYAALHDPAAPAAIHALQARFAAARARGDAVHRREEARFTLRLLHRPHEALRLALANWQVQREPADARVLLEAARAAGQGQLASAATDFITRSGWTDARLQGLL